MVIQQIWRLGGVAAVGCAALMATPSARAQPSMPQQTSSGAFNPGAPVIGAAKPAVGKLPPPPALPGSRVSKDEPAPADRPAAEMQPTDALFDAINRGDIAGVRDAMSRGADLSGENVLGLTPVDLSVDLGRNEITFLLMSLRGSASSKGPSGTSEAAAGSVPPKPVSKKPAVPKQTVAARTHMPATNEQARLIPAASAPGIRSADAGPGTPVPQAGFLGFGSGQATAQP